MNKPQKYTLLWGVVILFIGLDIWLLYNKIKLQQQVARLQVKTIQKGGAISTMAQEITFTPINKDSNSSISSKEIKLVAIFTDYGCTHCARAEIQRLNQWKKRMPYTLQVYYIGDSKEYMKTFGAHFSYRMVQSIEGLFSVTLPIGNPLVVLVDKNGNVQAIHTNDTSRPGSDQRRAAFYKRMYSLFQSVYETQ